MEGSLLSDERGRREILERALEELEHNVTVSQARIEALEQHIRA